MAASYHSFWPAFMVAGTVLTVIIIIICAVSISSLHLGLYAMAKRRQIESPWIAKSLIPVLCFTPWGNWQILMRKIFREKRPLMRYCFFRSMWAYLCST